MLQAPQAGRSCVSTQDAPYGIFSAVGRPGAFACASTRRKKGDLPMLAITKPRGAVAAPDRNGHHLVVNRSDELCGPPNTTPQTGAPMHDAADHCFVTVMPLKRLLPNPYQPRMEFNREQLEELAASIKADGLLSPIIVRPRGSHDFEIVAGERRKQAAAIAGLTAINCIIRETSEPDMMLLAIKENDLRVELNPIERATAYQRILGTGLTQKELSTKLGRAPSYVNNAVRLLTLPDHVQQRVIAGELTARAALELVTPSKDPALLAEIEAEIETQLALDSQADNPRRLPEDTRQLVKELDARGLTRDAIAKECGISGSSVSKILHADSGDGSEKAAGPVSYGKVAAAVKTVAERREAFNRSASRLDSPGITPAALAAWRGRVVEELLQREIERRGTENVLEALGVTLADAWRTDLCHPFGADYFASHSKAELLELAAELGLTVDERKPVDAIIRQFIATPKTKDRLPRELTA
jgi:ParB family chromosome partitioning protein